MKIRLLSNDRFKSVYGGEGFPWWLRQYLPTMQETQVVPGWGRSPGKGNTYPLQYSCLENSMDKQAWQATVHGVTKSRTQLSD